LVKNNPNLQIENIIGIDGEIEKYLVFFEKNIEKKRKKQNLLKLINS